MMLSFRKVFAFGVMAVLIGAVGVYGMRMIASQPSGSVEVDAVDYPFKLVMRLNKAIYEMGESVRIEMKLVNIGNSSIDLTLYFYHPHSSLAFKVYNETNDLVFYSEYWYAHFMAARDITLTADEFIGCEHSWEQIVGTPPDFLEFIGYPPYPYAKTGTYKIVGSLIYTSKVSLETPPVQITIG